MIESKAKNLNITFDLQQRALMNILEDTYEDRKFLEDQRVAVFNILEDLSEEQEELKASRKQFEELNSMLVALAAKTSTEEALDFLAWSLRTIGKFQKVAILSPASHENLKVAASSGFPKDWPLDRILVSLKGGNELLAHSYLTGNFFAVDNVRSPDVRIDNGVVEMLTLTSILVMPLSMGVDQRTLVIADRGELLPFSPQETAVFKTFTSQTEAVLIKINLVSVLEGQKKKLEELDQLKDDFLNIATHDLRAPATAIKGNLSMILEGDFGEVSPQVRELLDDACEGNERLIRIVGDFLNVSRIERGKIEIKPERCNLTKVVEAAVKQASSAAKDKGLYLKYIKAKLPPVLADEERTIEVLTNLLDNAIKYTKKGGVTLSHEIGKGEAAGPGGVITHISDTGVGISKKDQEELFRKFYRAPGQTMFAPAKGGLGLGLYICRLIVGGSGGRIWVESEKGKGSTFSFSLPVAKKGNVPNPKSEILSTKRARISKSK